MSNGTAPTELQSIGYWWPTDRQPAFIPSEIIAIAAQARLPIHIVRTRPGTCLGLAIGGDIGRSRAQRNDCFELMATLPALYPEWLGDRTFCDVHRVRFPYIAGEMANGIATARMVAAMARAEMLGFFGAAGLALERVEHAVDELTHELGNRAAWGVNLIHSPNEPELEELVADLLIKRGVQRISASAYMALTPAIVRCSASGLSRDASGQIVRRTHIFAKVSRTEIAAQFMSPPPAEILHKLVERGHLTSIEAELASELPVAEDITVEADSGGHTDNRPLVALLPAVLAVRDSIQMRQKIKRPIRVGAAGGLGTPLSVAAAFSLGAAYVLTGSVNQSAIESGLSEDAKLMLASADLVDVIMAPAADMFEQGVKVQVLRRGTMFGARSGKLYEIYSTYPSLDAIPPEIRSKLERDVLHVALDEVWAETQQYWQRRDPAEITLAERDQKHRMALMFRWYLGNASRWAIAGNQSRRTDYQIWCGPAMGAFNRWCAGTFLAEPNNRSVVQIARNLLEGAAVVTRAQQLRSYGVNMPAEAFDFRPRRLE